MLLRSNPAAFLLSLPHRSQTDPLYYLYMRGNSLTCCHHYTKETLQTVSLRFKFPQTSWRIIYPSVFLSTPTHTRFFFFYVLPNEVGREMVTGAWGGWGWGELPKQYNPRVPCGTQNEMLIRRNLRRIRKRVG